MELIQGFRISRIILSAFELEIFTIIHKGMLTSPEIALSCGTDARATDRLLNALVAIGLLTKERNTFSNTEFASAFLVKGSPNFMAGVTHSLNLWKTWSTLTDCIRKGTSVSMEIPIGERDEDWLTSFIAAMHSRRKQAAEVAAFLDLAGTSSVLDIGGGSGLFTFEMIRRNGNIKGTVFDLPSVVPITEEYIRKEGFTGRVNTLPGDYLLDDFGNGYDLVFVSAVVHINSPSENERLVKKCAQSLIAGGQLVILDHIMSEDRTEPGIGAVFALNMLVGTEKGDTYTETEIRGWMENAGFSEIKRIETTQGTSMLAGVKK